jgi:hypothetical protein
MLTGARIAVVACLMPAAGCGGMTRIVPLDPEQYQMTVYTHPAIVGSGTQLLARAWQEADDLCAKQGKSPQPVADADQDPAHVDRTAYAQVNFRCAGPERAK